MGKEYDRAFFARCADLKMPRMDGLQLWCHMREKDSEIQIIIVAGQGDIAMAVHQGIAVASSKLRSWSEA